ncbi:MAG: hypothetical protein AABW68_03290 [archaeon]
MDSNPVNSAMMVFPDAVGEAMTRLCVLHGASNTFCCMGLNFSNPLICRTSAGTSTIDSNGD